MKTGLYILSLCLLVSCGGLKNISQEAETTNNAIVNAANDIDGEAEQIEVKFPEAKPHTTAIKEKTPVIRIGSNEQLRRIRELEEEVRRLTEKQAKWLQRAICGLLVLIGLACAYLGITRGSFIRTAIGAGSICTAISLVKYWTFIETYTIPIFCIFGFIAVCLYYKDKDDERTKI